MTLHAKTLGQGADLVMLHGWGMHGGIMSDFAARLAGNFRVTLIDLPGHGQSGMVSDTHVRGMAEAVLAAAPPHAHWLGWSLGGVLSLQVAALCPAAVRSLILMAGTPRFVGDDGWPGVEPALLHQFGEHLSSNEAECLQRFLGLQVWGMDDARGLMKSLRACLGTREPPRDTALRAGLRILQDTDLRHALATSVLPVLAIFGRRDRLVPPAAGEALKQLNPAVEVRFIEGAAHLPFWTHCDAVAALVERFLLRHEC